MTIWKEKRHLYEVICNNPGFTVQKLSNVMGWHEKKILKYIEILLNDGLIKKSNNGFMPKSVAELINWDEMKNTTPPPRKGRQRTQHIAF